MLIIREVFRCKPGKAGALIEKFKAMNELSERRDLKASRILVDAVSTYWTVVTEFEVESLTAFEKDMAEYANDQEMRDAMAGYMELVDGGHREIFRVVE
jgi:hypothetical protein